MQQKPNILILAAFLVLAACGSKSNDSAELTAKKKQLEDLKKQQTEIGNNIAKLEAEVLKMDPSSKVEKSKLVVTAPIATEKFTHYIDLQGKVDAVNISFITPRGGGGQVRELYIKKGDNVSKGQLILKLDDALVKQSLVAAQQGLQSIKTQLAFAKNLYQKQQNLWAQNIGTEIQLITAKNNVENLENQLKSAEEQIKVTQEQMKFTSVYSDVTGVADDVNVRVGELFAGPGQIKVVNTTDLKVTTQIPENYANRVGVGTTIQISLPDINRTLEAKIGVAGKIIDPNSRSFYVEAKIPYDKNFRPNQIALVRVQDYQADNAVTIPINTLQNDEKGRFVMVAATENGKLVARKRVVIAGELYGNKLEVKSGLKAGDVLIVEGHQSLYDGQLITTDAK
ncbi:MAG: efflux transporter periplasmic adaptor subunit [Chitinophagaceae bacterium BSSC1]|nr:MAG: efflux transporter periplasmic adaptor subunit [Chitinophagaceae bacterium BSSC1]